MTARTLSQTFLHSKRFRIDKFLTRFGDIEYFGFDAADVTDAEVRAGKSIEPFAQGTRRAVLAAIHARHVKRSDTPTWKDRGVAVSTGTKTGALFRAIVGKNDEATLPRFSSTGASVTSDGFVLCDFTGRDGDYHMGAFVGSFSEIEDNLWALVDYVKLTKAERQEFGNAFDAWIRVDYRRATNQTRSACNVH